MNFFDYYAEHFPMKPPVAPPPLPVVKPSVVNSLEADLKYYKENFVWKEDYGCTGDAFPRDGMRQSYPFGMKCNNCGLARGNHSNNGYCRTDGGDFTPIPKLKPVLPPLVEGCPHTEHKTNKDPDKWVKGSRVILQRFSKKGDYMPLEPCPEYPSAPVHVSIYRKIGETK